MRSLSFFYFFLLLFLGGVFVLPIYNFMDVLSWHDQQRVGQIFLIAFCSCWGFVGKGYKDLDCFSLGVLLTLFVIGLISCVLADQKIWAFTEFSIFFGCFLISSSISDWRRLGGGQVDSWIWWVLVSIISVIFFKFFVSYVAAVVIHGPVDSLLLFDGFSWPRFLGQFQTLSLPFLLLPYLERRSHGKWWLAVTALWWFSTIAVGTRASWLGMMVAILVLPFIVRGGWRFSIAQSFSAICGVVLYFFLMRMVPNILGLPVGNLADDRLTTSLSGREVLWGSAWSMFLEHPWLGAGGMSFAAQANRLGAHPHQVVLQLMAEWGGLITLLFFILVLRAFFVFSKEQGRGGQSTYLQICLLASFIASLVHAMFDGSLVMPYTQIWLSILIGWAWGGRGAKGPSQRLLLRALSVFVSAFLLFVLIRDVPEIIQRNSVENRPVCWREAPRFWYNGIIKEGGCDTSRS